MTLRNQLSLDDLLDRPVGDIAAIPAEQLALLQNELIEASDRLKRLKVKFEGALSIRYGDWASQLRCDQQKDAGTVRFDDGAVEIVADLTKKVDWDQDKLVSLVERIRSDGDEPEQYVETVLKVPERRYSAWPEHLRRVFEPARTVRTGKPTFTLLIRSPSS